MAIKNGSNYRGLLYNFSGTSSTVISGCTTTASDYREPAYLTDTTKGDASIYNNVGITEALLQNEYNDMIKSVEKYKGFYVGRYKTSYDGNEVASKVAVNPTLASSFGKWYGMYHEQKRYASQNSVGNVVGSSMIWGSQYDAMLNWILKGNDKNKVTKIIEDVPIDIKKTGSDKEGVMNNIYDLTINCMEWTMEAWNSFGRVSRGAYPSGTGLSPSSRTSKTEPIMPSIPASSRITLYIKDDVTEDYTGYYADINGDGNVDGIIYKDLAKSNTSGEFKKYTIGQEVGGFGSWRKPMISISKTDGTSGKDRFYVMALKDVGKVKNSSYYWYYNAYNNGNISELVGTSSNGYADGKINTKIMLDKWKNNTYGQKNNNDIWSVIQNTDENPNYYLDIWFVPSYNEWEAFKYMLTYVLKYSKNDYSDLGLQNSYWSSSLESKYNAYMMLINNNTGEYVMHYHALNQTDHIRMSATF